MVFNENNTSAISLNFNWALYIYNSLIFIILYITNVNISRWICMIIDIPFDMSLSALLSDIGYNLIIVLVLIEYIISILFIKKTIHIIIKFKKRLG